MNRLMVLNRIAICFLVLVFMVSCKTTSQSTNSMIVGQIQGTNPDEEAIFAILEDLKNYITTKQWDKWLSLYSDDAILTTSYDKLSKTEMRSFIEGKTYRITEMEILKKDIAENQASVSVRMIGNGKKHYETYKLRKFDDKWLIVEETNP
jgi:ketosteroid isomerase-like protein